MTTYAIAILRSKWTRWAADAATSPTKRYGRATAKDLARFLDNSRNFGNSGRDVAAAVAQLVAETF